MSILLKFYGLGLAVVGLLILRAGLAKDRETMIRCATLVGLLTAFILFLLGGQWTVLSFCVLFAVLAFSELGNLNSKMKLLSRGLAVIAAIAFVMMLILQAWIPSGTLAAISGFSMLVIFTLLRKANQVGMPAWICLNLHVLCGFGAMLFLGVQRPEMLVAMVFLLHFNDGFAYIVGRKWGKTKLAPSISPKKSVEGAVGGFIATFLAFLLMRTPFLPLFTEGSLWHGVGLVFIVVVLGILGDLTYSIAKRRAGIKDFASFLPGHGGVLDRVDSLIAVLPIALLWNESFLA